MKNSQRQSRSSADYTGREGFTGEDTPQAHAVTAPAEPPSCSGVVYADVRSSLFKRLIAECFDRVIPVFIFPVIIAAPILLIGKEYFVPMWFFVLFAWNLLRDSSPNQRSLGKKLRKLRVVMANGQDKCAWWRLILRRSGSAVSQLFYAMALGMLFPSWDMSQSAIAVAQRIFSLFGADCPEPQFLMLSALVYDIVSLIAILISPAGQRIEDLVTKTRVIPESAFLEHRKQCAVCRRWMSKRVSHCPHCGALNFISRKGGQK